MSPEDDWSEKSDNKADWREKFDKRVEAAKTKLALEKQSLSSGKEPVIRNQVGVPKNPKTDGSVTSTESPRLSFKRITKTPETVKSTESFFETRKVTRKPRKSTEQIDNVYYSRFKTVALALVCNTPINLSVLMQVLVFLWTDYTTGSLPVSFNGWFSFLLTQFIYGIMSTCLYFLGCRIKVEGASLNEALWKLLDRRPAVHIPGSVTLRTRQSKEIKSNWMPTGLPQAYHVSKKIVGFTKSNWKLLTCIGCVYATVPYMYPQTSCRDRQSVWFCIVPDLFELFETKPVMQPRTEITPTKTGDTLPRLQELVLKSSMGLADQASTVTNMSNVTEWNQANTQRYGEVCWATCNSEKLLLDTENLSTSLMLFNTCTTNLASATVSVHENAVVHSGLVHICGRTVTQDIPDFISEANLVNYQLAEFEKKAIDTSVRCANAACDVMTEDSGIVVALTKQTQLQFHGIDAYVKLGKDCINRSMNNMSEFSELVPVFADKLSPRYSYIEDRIKESYKKIEQTQLLRDEQVAEAMNKAAAAESKLNNALATLGAYQHGLVVLSISFVVIFLFSTGAGTGAAIGMANTAAQAALPGPAGTQITYGMWHGIAKCAWAWFVGR